MDRDVLLLLLAGAVLLNTGLLVLVGILRLAHAADATPPARRAWPSPSLRPRVQPAVPPATAAEIAAVAPTPSAPTLAPVSLFDGATAAPAASATATATTATASEASPAPAANPEYAPRPATSTGVATPPTPPATAPTSTPATAGGVTAEAPAAEPASPAPQPARRIGEPTTRPSRSRSGSRPRRFTMPDLDDDHERATRSIAAFLGEPVARSSGVHSQRRRHRARRPAGSASRTDLVLVLSGEAGDARLVHAAAAALREAARESDEVVELPGGRLRVSLDAEPAGAEAFLDRARTVVRPWLSLFGSNVELRVEHGLPADHATTVAS